jgi:hypothetical protein
MAARACAACQPRRRLKGNGFSAKVIQVIQVIQLSGKADLSV